MNADPSDLNDLDSAVVSSTDGRSADGRHLVDARETEPGSRPERHAADSNSVNSWLVVILLIVVSAVLLRNAGLLPLSWLSSAARPRPIQPRGDLAEDEKSTIAIFKEASSSVVHITSIAVRRDLSLNLMQIPEGTGTGFLWDENGHVVTNYHVIESGNSAIVTLNDKTSWQAQLVGVAPEKDLAVLKIDVSNSPLRPLPVGESRDLLVGQKVFAIGNPFGLDQTLTTGIISGLGREIESRRGYKIEGVIQTDAAINPGNSGGPLLDSAGRLIGVNTAIYSPSGAYAGIGFAVPVDIVNDVIPQLISNGRLARAGMGIALADDSVAEALGVEEGAVIQSVQSTGAAAEAGIRPPWRDRDGRWHFEVIMAINGRKIASSKDIRAALDGKKVGDVVEVTLLRDGEPATVSITLQDVSARAR